MSEQNSNRDNKWDYMIVKYEHGDDWTVVKKSKVRFKELQMTV